MSDNLNQELWNEYYRDPIHLDKSKIKNLLDQGANPNLFHPGSESRRTLFMIVIFSNDCEYAEMMLNYGADVNLKDVNGNTALHIASSKENYKIIELLLENGSNIDAVNQYGNTPLIQYIAYWPPYPKRVKFLVDHGADVNIENNQGKRAIDFTDNEEVKEILRNAELPGPKGAIKK